MARDGPLAGAGRVPGDFAALLLIALLKKLAVLVPIIGAVGGSADPCQAGRQGTDGRGPGASSAYNQHPPIAQPTGPNPSFSGTVYASSPPT